MTDTHQFHDAEVLGVQFHHHGYVTTDPRRQPAAGVGLDRPPEIPDEVDVLVVGAGPAGMLLAAQLSQYPSVNVRLVERRTSRLAVGQADGIQARSVETFQAFGFAERLVAEAYRFCVTNFWAPDPADPARIVRIRRTEDDPYHVSEFPHLTINQARVLDYFAEAAANGPGRVEPDHGWSFEGLRIVDESERPVRVTLRRTLDAAAPAEEKVVSAKYVVGTDGARSRVREAIGLELEGNQAMHAWAVMDALAETDFPDIRVKCAIQSDLGSILLIPREGGYLCRLYIDLGEVGDHDNRAVRATTPEAALERANRVLHPYTLQVRDVPWFSVYEVAHRLTARFDDVGSTGTRPPRVFIAGDACHTHSAKAGQGMNVSMQDTFNLGWKLGQVLTGLSPASLLDTYSAERWSVAKALIDFDREWSAMMARRPGELSPEELADHLVASSEFTAGFRTQYEPSEIVGAPDHQHLAPGFPIGRRFRSPEVVRVADAHPVHLGHHARADGRWRVYAFADAAVPVDATELSAWAAWMIDDPASPVHRFGPEEGPVDRLFDVKVVFGGPYEDVDLPSVPSLFRPRTGPFHLVDHEKVYAVDPAHDVFGERGIGGSGALVVVRPDQYVAHVLPLTARDELTGFFERTMFARAVGMTGWA